jgi:hypothetical protein
MSVSLKYGTLLLAFLLCCQCYAQGRAYDKIEYRKDASYQGPDDWGANSPSSMREKDEPPLSEDIDPGRIDYTEEDIERHRQSGQGTASGGGETDGEYVQEPEPLDLPEPDEPEQKPEDDFNTGPPKWLSKLFLVILIIAAALGLGYVLMRLRKNTNVQQQTTVQLEEDPTELTQSEFERLLSEALKTGNYREAVRLYFVAVLKELIQLELIRWKKDKTNQAYRNELRGHVLAAQFSQCVRIYEYVWYGHYSLSQETFAPIELQMKVLLKKLTENNAK